MEGNGPKDLLFLQIKQEVASAYAPNCPEKTGHRDPGRRRPAKIQPISDLLLGWTRIGEHDYLVRQLNDHKVGLDLEQLKGSGLNDLGGIAGELLATVAGMLDQATRSRSRAISATAVKRSIQS